MISFDEDILPPGVYTGFFKGGWTKLKKKNRTQYTNPPHESGTEQENLGGQAGK